MRFHAIWPSAYHQFPDQAIDDIAFLWLHMLDRILDGIQWNRTFSDRHYVFSMYRYEAAYYLIILPNSFCA